MATAAGSGARLVSARGNKKKFQMLAKKNVNYSYVRGLNIKTYLLYSDVFIFYCSSLSLAYKKKEKHALSWKYSYQCQKDRRDVRRQ